MTVNEKVVDADSRGGFESNVSEIRQNDRENKENSITNIWYPG
jgi:hypothetical protein